MPNFQTWDLKYYYQVHCNKQKAQWLYPVTYATFSKRLKKMNLHDAIYTPRVEHQVRDRKIPTTIEDSVRRRQINKEENIQILELNELMKVEQKYAKKPTKQTKTEKTETIRPKQSLLDRFISLFR